MIDLARACARHRPLLVDFVDRGEVQAGTGAALAHLDGCARCTDAIESTMLTIIALRRLGSEAAIAEPRADAWPRLRVRIEAWSRRPRVMSPVAGIAMSAALVVGLVLPLRLGGTAAGLAASPPIGSGSTRGADDSRIEADYISAIRRAERASRDDPKAFLATASSYPRTYPDNYRPTRKEVGSAEPTGRPPEAI